MSIESEFHAWLRRRLPPQRQAPLGLSDDAAILDLPTGGRCAVSVDMLMDGIDFRLEEVEPRRVGRKCLAVNLSDMAAMAARPVAALIALALPRIGGLALAQELYEGLLPLAERYDVAVAGGDTNAWDGPLAVSITLLGQTTGPGPLCRSGARPGDEILVTGAFGGSILGRHLDFEPRVAEAIALHRQYELHAGMDVSDGLSLDLSRMAAESGCGAEIELAVAPVADDARRLAEMRSDGSTPLEHALADGEDFELILAVSPEEAARMLADRPLAVPLTRIGRFVTQLGLWQVGADGRRSALTPRGYEH